MVVLGFTPRNASCIKNRVLFCTELHLVRLVSNLGFFRSMSLTVTDQTIP